MSHTIKYQYPTESNEKKSRILFKVSQYKIHYNQHHKQLGIYGSQLDGKTLDESLKKEIPILKYILNETKRSLNSGLPIEIPDLNIQKYNQESLNFKNYSFYISIQPVFDHSDLCNGCIVFCFENPSNLTKREAIRLVEFSTHLAQLLDHQKTAELSLKSLLHSLEIESATACLYLIDDHTSHLNISAYINVPKVSLQYWKDIPLTPGLCPLVDSVLQKKLLLFQTPQAILGQYPHLKDWLSPGYGYVTIPLISRTRTLGAFILGFSQEAAFSPEKINLLESLTDQMAHAIVRSFTHQAEVKARKLLECQNIETDYLNRFSKAVFNTLDIDTLLDQISQFVTHSHFQGCIIQIHSSSTHPERVLVHHTQTQLEQELKERVKQPLSSSFFNQYFSLEQFILGNLSLISAQEHSDQWKEILQLNNETLSLSESALDRIQLFINPLIRKKEVIGSIVFILPDSLEFDLSFYQRLAFEVTVRSCLTLENAFLHQETKSALATRDEFFSLASHELKTPLTTLKLQSQLRNRSLKALAEQFQPCQKLLRASELENRQIDHLAQLINTMLDVVKVQEGKYELSYQHVDLCRLIRDVTESFGIRFENSKSLIQLQLPPDALMIHCDPHKISQSLDNLLSNALKYGEERPIIVRMQKHQTQVVLQVKDHGSGINPQDQERIFERFERLEEHQKIRGLGLGLYVVKKMIEAHEGTISVESHKGEGTLFTLTLPLSQIRNPHLSHEASTPLLD